MFTKSQLTALSGASSAEEAAQMVKAAITTGLAKIIADALNDAVTKTKKELAPSSAIEGWDKFIGGAAIQMAWDRQSTNTSFPAQVSTYAPLQSDGMSATGMSWGGSIVITGTF